MNNQEVESFVEDIELVSPFKANIIKQVCSYYQDQSSATLTIEERIIYGGVGFFIGGTHFSGAYPNKHHVNLAFSRGVELEDPKSLLQGKGKFRRHLQLFSVDELEEKEAETFIKQSVELQVNHPK